MKRDILFITIIVSILLSLFLGIFIRGLEEESLIENKKLMTFRSPSLESFFDTSYQNDMEEAISDQLLLGTFFKNQYTSLKNANTRRIVAHIESLWPDKPAIIEAEPVASVPQDPVAKPSTSVNDISFENAGEESIEQDEAESVEATTLEEEPQESSDPVEAPEAPLVPEDMNPVSVVKVQNQIKVGMDKVDIQYMSNDRFKIAITPRGSGLVEVAGSQHLVGTFLPLNQVRDILVHRAKHLNTFVKAHPDIRFYSYYIETDLDVDLLNGYIPHQNVSLLKETLDPQMGFSAMTINTPLDLLNYYHKADHHWDVQGQIAGYKGIVDLIFSGSVAPRTLQIYQTNLPFTGYKGRLLNDLTIYDEFAFISSALPAHRIEINGNPSWYGRKNSYINGNVEIKDAFNYYADCYGYDYGQVVYYFDQPEKSNALIFVESFSNPIKDLLASHFNQTTFIDVRHYEKAMGQPFSMSAFLEEHDVDVVLFMGYYQFYNGLVLNIHE